MAHSFHGTLKTTLSARNTRSIILKEVFLETEKVDDAMTKQVFCLNIQYWLTRLDSHRPRHTKSSKALGFVSLKTSNLRVVKVGNG
jgi:hypothetical protein